MRADAVERKKKSYTDGKMVGFPTFPKSVLINHATFQQVVYKNEQ